MPGGTRHELRHNEPLDFGLVAGGTNDATLYLYLAETDRQKQTGEEWMVQGGHQHTLAAAFSESGWLLTVTAVADPPASPVSRTYRLTKEDASQQPWIDDPEMGAGQSSNQHPIHQPGNLEKLSQLLAEDRTLGPRPLTPT